MGGGWRKSDGSLSGPLIYLRGHTGSTQMLGGKIHPAPAQAAHSGETVRRRGAKKPQHSRTVVRLLLRWAPRGSPPQAEATLADFGDLDLRQRGRRSGVRFRPTMISCLTRRSAAGLRLGRQTLLHTKSPAHHISPARYSQSRIGSALHIAGH